MHSSVFVRQQRGGMMMDGLNTNGTSEYSWFYRAGEEEVCCSRCGIMADPGLRGLRAHARECHGTGRSLSLSGACVKVFRTPGHPDTCGIFRQNGTGITFTVYSVGDSEMSGIEGGGQIRTLYRCEFLPDCTVRETEERRCRGWFKQIDDGRLFVPGKEGVMEAFRRLYPRYLEKTSFSCLFDRIANGRLKQDEVPAGLPEEAAARFSHLADVRIVDVNTVFLMTISYRKGVALALFLRMLPRKDYLIVLSEGWIWSSSFLDLDRIFHIPAGSVIGRTEGIRRMAACYPRMMLGRYSGRFPLIELIGPFYHPVYELLCKAGLGQIADAVAPALFRHNGAKEYLSDPWATNLRDIFGFPASILRKFPSCPEIAESFRAVSSVYRDNRALLEVDAFSPWYLFFLKDYVVTAPSGECYCRQLGFEAVPSKKLLPVLRYVNRLPDKDSYGLYLDYLRSCAGLGGEYPAGYCPRSLKQAHDEAAEQVVRQIVDNLQVPESEFQRALERAPYRRLEDLAGDEGDDAGFLLRRPHSMEEVQGEAENMHNCVSSYIPWIVTGSTYILFLRRRAEPDKSYVTVEVTHQMELVQAKAAFNTLVPAEAARFLIGWAARNKIKINTDDLRLAAEEDLPDKAAQDRCIQAG